MLIRNYTMYKSQTKSVYGVCDLIVSCCFVPRPSPFLLSVCVCINTQEQKSSTPVYCCEYKQNGEGLGMALSVMYSFCYG